MAIYHVLGTSILTDTEYQVKAAEEAERAQFIETETSKFTDIGIGKPLTVQIRHVYTGQFPRQNFFSSEKDMLITSAMKDVAVFNAASRAVNFVCQAVAPKSRFDTPTATEQGTPLVWYTPAVTSSSTILTLEIIFDEFPNGLFAKISTAIQSIAGLPIFLPSAGYLLAASTVVKLAGNLGQALFDGKPAFAATETIDFDVPGAIIAEAQFRIICNPGFDISDFHFVPKRGMLDSHDRVYDGPEPYIVISLDGKKRDEYKDFGATAASAALMQRFYNVKDGSETAIDTVVDSMRLFNDSKFRAQIDAIDKKLANIDPKSAEGKELAEKRKALTANIMNDVMQPKPLLEIASASS